MDPKLESNSNSSSSTSTDENEGILDTYRRKYSNSDSNGKSAAPYLQSNSIAMPSLLNSRPSYNDNNKATNSTVEEVTNDDLQAMKNMIGDSDIKKDPSLLYRLSSLFYVLEE